MREPSGSAALQNGRIEIGNAKVDQQWRQNTPKGFYPVAITNISELANSIREPHQTAVKPFPRNYASRNEIIHPIDFVQFGV